MGQIVYKNNNKTNKDYIEFKINNLNSGAYIIKIKSENKNLTKKVVVD